MGSAAGTSRIPGKGRVDVIDFWRGAVLVVIFINHIPGNVFDRITPRNFGFSDSAEAFVFLSGLSVALAWGRMVARGDVGAVIERAWRRSFLLYTVHLLLTFTAIALYANAFVLTGEERFLLDHGRDVIFEEPLTAIVGIVSLGLQMGYYNILPLYILLVFLAPFILEVVWRRPLAALAVSFVIYVIAQLPQVNLPSWPVPGLWFLNPFAWQFVFVIGMVMGVLSRRDGLTMAPSRPATLMAGLFLAFAAIVVTNAFGFVPGLFDRLYALGGFDKTDMNVMRLMHFLALAYLVVQLRIGERLLGVAGGGALALIGRHGLAIFALGSVLSSAGQIFTTLTEGTRLSHTAFTGLIVVPAGVMCLYWFAQFLEGRAAARRLASAGSRAAATA